MDRVKTFLAALVGLAILASATPAPAYLVAVATSVDTTGIAGQAELEAAVEKVVDDVLTHAIAFAPTFVRLQNSRVIGNRIYFVLLIGDGEGEETLARLSGE